MNLEMEKEDKLYLYNSVIKKAGTLALLIMIHIRIFCALFMDINNLDV